MNLYRHGKWQPVVVDDVLPCDSSSRCDDDFGLCQDRRWFNLLPKVISIASSLGPFFRFRLAFAKVVNDQLWPVLLEKALVRHGGRLHLAFPFFFVRINMTPFAPLCPSLTGKTHGIVHPADFW